MIQQRSAEDFVYLFENSRHIAHGVETTQIAAEVVERMEIACESLRPTHGESILTTRAHRLDFLHSMLRGLVGRSVSNEKRLTSEQVLVGPQVVCGKVMIRMVANLDVDTSFPI